MDTLPNVINKPTIKMYEQIQREIDKIEDLECQWYALKMKEIFQDPKVDDIILYMEYDKYDGDYISPVVTEKLGHNSNTDDEYDGVLEDLSEVLNSYLSKFVFNRASMVCFNNNNSHYSVKARGVENMLNDFFGEKNFALYQAMEIEENTQKNSNTKNKPKI